MKLNKNAAVYRYLVILFLIYTVPFNLSKKVLTDAEIKVLEKGLDYAPIQNKVNEPELCSDFEECCRRIRLKRYCRNDPTPNFNEGPSFTPKLSWKTPSGHPNIELFLSEFERKNFKIVQAEKQL